MGKARDILTGRSYGLRQYLYSLVFFVVKRISNRWQVFIEKKKSVKLDGKGKIGIHHRTFLNLKNSKIIVHGGALKIGIDFGYFDPGEFDPRVDNCRILLINSTLETYGDVSLYPGVVIYGINAHIIIRNGTKINGGTHIISLKKVEIGEDCFFAKDIIIRDNDGHKFGAKDSVNEELETKEVIIGSHCWIGQRAMILKGVALADNVIVGAGAVVSGRFPSNVAVAGIPAKIIKENVSWSA